MGEQTSQSEEPGLGWRLKLGGTLFIFNLVLPDPVYYALGGDILFLVGLFVIGGDFWDKIRSLFVHDSEVRFKV